VNISLNSTASLLNLSENVNSWREEKREKGKSDFDLWKLMGMRMWVGQQGKEF
jgi:hypothetical protein